MVNQAAKPLTQSDIDEDDNGDLNIDLDFVDEDDIPNKNGEQPLEKSKPGIQSPINKPPQKEETIQHHEKSYVKEEL